MNTSARAVLLLSLALGACTTIHDVSEQHDGGRYRVGQSNSVRAGEIMLDRYRYSAAPAARIKASIPPADGRLGVSIGTRLVGRTVDGARAYCTPITTNFACFYDRDGDLQLDQVLVSNLGIVGSPRPLNPPVAYTLEQVDDDVRGYKSELIYQGRSGNDIDLLYRDYNDNLRIPTYEQKLHYTLAAQGATEIKFREARIKVLQADAQSIRYEILSGFEG